MGGDLAGSGVYGNVELAPLPTGAAVLLGIPHALSEQLQAGAVQHEVHGSVVPDNPGLPTGKGVATRPRRLASSSPASAVLRCGDVDRHCV